MNEKQAQTLLRLVANAEVAKNRKEEAKRVEDIKEHNRLAMRNTQIFNEAQIVMSIISEMGANA
jgi:hypothetical protein